MHKRILWYFVVFFGSLAFFAFALYHSASTPVAATPLKGKTVIIDAGHGLPDGGASSDMGHSESEINLQIAKKLQKLLKKSKVNVIMTRSDENSLSTSKTNNKRDDLQKRVNIRKTSDADLFVSIHLNHFSDSRYRGAQTFYSSSNPQSKVLAKKIQDSLIKLADPENTREIKCSDSIYVIKGAEIPSVLVECGFLSNPEEARLVSDSEYQQKIVWSVYCGICDFFEQEK